MSTVHSNSLTDRERQVLLLIRLGKTNNEIAEELEVSVNTVKTHLKHLFKKIGANNRTHAATMPII